MKIASWNVNSIRTRMNHIIHFLNTNSVDFLCLQETKVTDDLFPESAFNEIGYQCFFTGQKSYNGVAILARSKHCKLLSKHLNIPGDEQKRLIAIAWENTLILNVYVPNGQSLESDKYHYKLAWLEHFNTFVQQHKSQYDNMIILGDFNIIPSDKDAHDPHFWNNKILCSAAEREALSELKNMGFTDCLKTLHPNESIFTWWDYRMNAFKRNMGLRIDLIFANSKLFKTCKDCWVNQEPRKEERPSDHAPVLAEFTL